MNNNELILEAMKIALEQQSMSYDKLIGIFITNLTACGALAFFSQTAVGSRKSGLTLVIVCLCGVGFASALGAAYYAELETFWTTKVSSYTSSILRSASFSDAFADAENLASETIGRDKRPHAAFAINFIPALLLMTFLVLQYLSSRKGRPDSRAKSKLI